jgi:hypothetical protein
MSTARVAMHRTREARHAGRRVLVLHMMGCVDRRVYIGPTVAPSFVPLPRCISLDEDDVAGTGGSSEIVDGTIGVSKTMLHGRSQHKKIVWVHKLTDNNKNDINKTDKLVYIIKSKIPTSTRHSTAERRHQRQCFSVHDERRAV